MCMYVVDICKNINKQVDVLLCTVPPLSYLAGVHNAVSSKAMSIHNISG